MTNGMNLSLETVYSEKYLEKLLWSLFWFIRSSFYPWLMPINDTTQRTCIHWLNTIGTHKKERQIIQGKLTTSQLNRRKQANKLCHLAPLEREIIADTAKERTAPDSELCGHTIQKRTRPQILLSSINFLWKTLIIGASKVMPQLQRQNTPSLAAQSDAASLESDNIEHSTVGAI